MLSIFVNENRSNWDDHLPYLMIAYRTTVHERTKCTSNLIIIGRETYLPIDVLADKTPTNPQEIGCCHSYVEWIRNSMEITYGIVNENLQSSFKKK